MVQSLDLREAEGRILSDPIIGRVFKEASERGVRIYLVGGAVRDFLLGREPKDYDFILEDFCPSFLRRLGDTMRTTYFPLGKGRGERVFRLVKDGKVLDFTLMAGRSLQEDLLRRDFTINAIAYSPQQRRFYAPQRALEDLKAGRIDLLSPKALLNDPLRILRALRYCSTIGFSITKRAEEEIKRQKDLLKKVAKERILMELDEIISSASPERALRPLASWGLLEVLFPEMEPLKGLEQGEYHQRDAFLHSVEVAIKALEIARKDDLIPFTPQREDYLVLGYTGLFHDLGKPATRKVDQDGRVHFYGHPKVSKELALRIMKRYPFPSAVRERVLRLVENHMRPLTLTTGNPTDRALRRLIHEMGEDIKPLLIFGLAEIEEKGRGDGERGAYLGLCQRILDLMSKEDVIHPPPLLRGQDLLDMGFSPGPAIGEILREVRRLQIEGELRTKEDAINFVRERFTH